MRLELIRIQDRLKTACRFVDAHPKWVAPQNLYITLLFLGYVPEERLCDVIDTIKQTALNVQSFVLRLQGLELFPPGKKDRKVLAAEAIGGVAKLENLNQVLVAQFEAAGLPIEDRQFRAHLTLARLTSIKMISRFQPIVDSHNKLLSASIPVAEIVLFESILEPEGPCYFPLERVPLMAVAEKMPEGQIEDKLV